MLKNSISKVIFLFVGIFSIATSTTPSTKPSLLPSKATSTAPSVKSSLLPSMKPSSSTPTKTTSTAPSVKSSLLPSMKPSSSTPTKTTSTAPSVKSSFLPSTNPTIKPSVKPSAAPTKNPSARPTAVAAANLFYGQLYYTDANTCNKLNSFMLISLNYCLPTTNVGSSAINGHKKITCGSDSASIQDYAASDATCTTSKESNPAPNYNVCPATTSLSKNKCLGSADIAPLTNSVKGVVYSFYSSQLGCTAKDSSFVNQIYYSPTAFDLDGVYAYTCTLDGKGGSYAYVCNGVDGLQQLGYATSLECKGAATQIRAGTFADLGLSCAYNSDTSAYQSPACYGPANMY